MFALDTDQAPVYSPRSKAGFHVKGRAQVLLVTSGDDKMATDGLGGIIPTIDSVSAGRSDRVWIQVFRSLHCLMRLVGDPIYLSEKFNVSAW